MSTELNNFNSNNKQIAQTIESIGLSPEKNGDNYLNNLTEEEREFLQHIAQKLKLQEEIQQRKNELLNKENNQNYFSQQQRQQIQQPDLQEEYQQQQQTQSGNKKSLDTKQSWFFRSLSPQSKISSNQQQQQLYRNWQEREECTFKPKINKNAQKLSNRNPNLKEKDYMVNVLYQDAQNRQKKEDEKKKSLKYQEQNLMNKPKTDIKSQSIVQKKLEDTINKILNDIDDVDDMPGFINFENLGMFLEKLGIFKALNFVKTGNDQTSLFLHDRIDQERLKRETKCHEELWKILTFNNQEEQSVPKLVLFTLIMILIQQRLEIQQSVYYIKQTIENYSKQNFLSSHQAQGVYQQNKKKKSSECYGNDQNDEKTQQKHQDENDYEEDQKQQKQKQQEGDEGDNEQQQQDENEDYKDDDNWNLQTFVVQFRKLMEDKNNIMQLYQSNKSHMLNEFQDGKNNSQSFHPQINKTSKLFEQSMNDGYIMKQMKESLGGFCQQPLKKRYDLLYEYSKLLLEKKEDIKNQQNIKNMELYTFKPQVNNYNSHKSQKLNEDNLQYTQNEEDSSNNNINRYDKLHQHSKKREEKFKQQRDQIEKLKEDKEMENCSFRPQLISKNPRPDNNMGNSFIEIKGTKNMIDRYNKAREDKSKVDSYWDKRQENWVSHDYSKLTNTMPFSFISREKSYRERGEAIGNVDVNFSKGKKGRIIVHRGDDPQTLSANFAKIYSLNEDMQVALTEMLEKYIKDLENSENANNNNNKDEISNISKITQNQNSKSQSNLNQSSPEGKKN